MKKLLLVFSLLLTACSHSEPDRSAEEASAISVLPGPAVDESVALTEKEIAALDQKIRGAEVRRDSYRLQMVSDPNKESAFDGAEAELATLEAKRARLEHRKHLLEGRKRELNKGKDDELDY